MKPLHTARLLCLSLFLQQAANAECQNSDELVNPFSIAIRGHYGFIIPHSRAIAEISNSNPWGIEADLALHLMRERIWKHCYCYPFWNGSRLVNRIYDAETNPDIFFFSHHLSFIVMLNAAVNYRLSSTSTTSGILYHYNNETTCHTEEGDKN